MNTNAGYGIGTSFATVSRLCPDSTILQGFSIKGGVERDDILFVMKDEKAVAEKTDVQGWLWQIKVLN